MDFKEIIYDICMIVNIYLRQNMIIITYVLSFVLLHRNRSGGNCVNDIIGAILY